MNCPICSEKNRIEIDMHCDGFAEALEECGQCGSVWTLNGGKTSMLHGPTESFSPV